jgi:mercuric ion transport protein
MADRRLLGIGLLGAAVSALCCFTPVLVLVLAGLGLSAVTGWLDCVLLPALAVFIGIAAYGTLRKKPA